MAGSSTASDLQVTRVDAGRAHASPCFYLDFSVPEAYLAAERILSLMPAPCEWVPVRLPGASPPDEAELARVERLVVQRRLQRVRWPARVPFDPDLALRAATYAKGAGKTVAFTLAAFRQAYAGGRDLSEPDNVAIAGAACEIHPRALLQGAATRSVAAALARATDLARERGVRTVPAVWARGQVFHGDAELERAAAAMCGG